MVFLFLFEGRFAHKCFITTVAGLRYLRLNVYKSCTHICLYRDLLNHWIFAMNAQELHNACHEACTHCPQFEEWDDDTHIQGWGEFGNIPKKGMAKVIKFWREEGQVLWEYGYSEHLPHEVKKLFDNIDSVIDKAIRDYCARI